VDDTPNPDTDKSQGIGSFWERRPSIAPAGRGIDNRLPQAGEICIILRYFGTDDDTRPVHPNVRDRDLRAFSGNYITAFLVCGWVLSGCNQIYGPEEHLFRDAITERIEWKATGTLTDPHRAIDGDINTAATAGACYHNATLDIDLGKACLINMIAVDHGPRQFGFPRRMAVLTSDDGIRWKEQAVVPGLRRVTNVLLVKQVLARYIRLQAIIPGDRPWVVAEVYLN